MTSSSCVHIGNASAGTSPSITAQFSTRRYARTRLRLDPRQHHRGDVAVRHAGQCYVGAVRLWPGGHVATDQAGQASVMAPFSAPWARRAYLARTPLV